MRLENGASMRDIMRFAFLRFGEKKDIKRGKTEKKVNFFLLPSRQIGICQSCNAFISRYF